MSLFEERLTDLHGGRLLDVATGGGRFIEKLDRYFKDIDEVVGIDISDDHFAEISQRLKDHRVSLLVMDAANLEFADESFDTVAMAAGMHHMDDVAPALSEMMRVLRAGGTLVLREMFRDGLNEKQTTDLLQHDWQAKVGRLLGVSHYPSLTRQEIIDYVAGLGLTRFDTEIDACDDCPRSRGETVEKEITEMDERLAQVRNLLQYDELKTERDRIVSRLRTVGISCQPSLDIVGVK
jgi:SAM-dependent methyltransferase